MCGLYAAWWCDGETFLLAFLAMKRKEKISTFIFLLWLTTILPLWSQEPRSFPEAEEVGLITDRNLYIIGEDIQFAAFIASELTVEESKVLYVELIAPNGKRADGNKFQITNASAHGCLQIPEEMVTGHYYLRAYTKYMRNAGPGVYAYVSLKIINPFNNEILSITDNTESTQPWDVPKVAKEEIFLIAPEKKEYVVGESVNVTIVKNDLTHHFFGSMNSVSVVPEFTGFELFRNKESHDHSVKNVIYQPEHRGISITGQLINGVTGASVANGRVNLSIIGQGRDFEAMQTDSAGRYFFSLPDYTGQRDIFLCAETDTLTRPVLRVDNDFCSLPVSLPSPEFHLNAQERSAAFQLFHNARVTKYFHPDTMLCYRPHETSQNPFYGQPSDVLVFDEFVQLPTLEEYFNELPSSVKVRKQSGHKYFKVIGERAEMNYFNPLVMVDWVAVNNPEKILAASPNNIDRIEVITVPYIKGNITYGGIVSIISRKGNFAGIDLPNSGIFFNYKFYADTCHCDIKQAIAPDQPDARNTLYWNPGVVWDANQRAEISFTAPSVPGKYNIVVKGIELNGGPYQQAAELIIKAAE